MSGLLFLSSDDFAVVRGTRGNILSHGIKGFSLILFYSTQCVYCQNLIPIFKSLPGSIGGCQFGMINVQNNRQILLKSKQTISPITYVPYIILYVDGIPFMRYDSAHDEGTIRKFVFDVAQQLHAKQQFLPQNQINDGGREIPAYTIGKPVLGDKKHPDICYLEFEDIGKPVRIKRHPNRHAQFVGAYRR